MCLLLDERYNVEFQLRVTLPQKTSERKHENDSTAHHVHIHVITNERDI